MEIKIEGVGDLETIVAHYKAVPILIEFIKKHDSGMFALQAWDEARCKKPKIQVNTKPYNHP